MPNPNFDDEPGQAPQKSAAAAKRLSKLEERKKAFLEKKANSTRATQPIVLAPVSSGDFWNDTGEGSTKAQPAAADVHPEPVASHSSHSLDPENHSSPSIQGQTHIPSSPPIRSHPPPGNFQSPLYATNRFGTPPSATGFGGGGGWGEDLGDIGMGMTSPPQNGSHHNTPTRSFNPLLQVSPPEMPLPSSMETAFGFDNEGRPVNNPGMLFSGRSMNSSFMPSENGEAVGISLPSPLASPVEPFHHSTGASETGALTDGGVSIPLPAIEMPFAVSPDATYDPEQTAEMVYPRRSSIPGTRFSGEEPIVPTSDDLASLPPQDEDPQPLEPTFSHLDVSVIAGADDTAPAAQGEGQTEESFGQMEGEVYTQAVRQPQFGGQPQQFEASHFEEQSQFEGQVPFEAQSELGAQAQFDGEVEGQPQFDGQAQPRFESNSQFGQVEGQLQPEEQAQLEQAQLEQAQLEQAQLEQAQLEQAQLEQAQLEQAQLEQAQLEQAQLEQARLEQAQLEQAQLEQAQLEQAQLEQAQLEQAQLEQAQLASESQMGRAVDLEHDLQNEHQLQQPQSEEVPSVEVSASAITGMPADVGVEPREQSLSEAAPSHSAAVAYLITQDEDGAMSSERSESEGVLVTPPASELSAAQQALLGGWDDDDLGDILPIENGGTVEESGRMEAVSEQPHEPDAQAHGNSEASGVVEYGSVDDPMQYAAPNAATETTVTTAATQPEAPAVSAHEELPVEVQPAEAQPEPAAELSEAQRSLLGGWDDDEEEEPFPEPATAEASEPVIVHTEASATVPHESISASETFTAAEVATATELSTTAVVETVTEQPVAAATESAVLEATESVAVTGTTATSESELPESHEDGHTPLQSVGSEERMEESKEETKVAEPEVEESSSITSFADPPASLADHSNDAVQQQSTTEMTDAPGELSAEQKALLGGWDDDMDDMISEDAPDEPTLQQNELQPDTSSTNSHDNNDANHQPDISATHDNGWGDDLDLPPVDEPQVAVTSVDDKPVAVVDSPIPIAAAGATLADDTKTPPQALSSASPYDYFSADPPKQQAPSTSSIATEPAAIVEPTPAIEVQDDGGWGDNLDLPEVPQDSQTPDATPVGDAPAATLAGDAAPSVSVPAEPLTSAEENEVAAGEPLQLEGGGWDDELPPVDEDSAIPATTAAPPVASSESVALSTTSDAAIAANTASGWEDDLPLTEFDSSATEAPTATAPVTRSDVTPSSDVTSASDVTSVSDVAPASDIAPASNVTTTSDAAVSTTSAPNVSGWEDELPLIEPEVSPKQSDMPKEIAATPATATKVSSPYDFFASQPSKPALAEPDVPKEPQSETKMESTTSSDNGWGDELELPPFDEPTVDAVAAATATAGTAPTATATNATSPTTPTASDPVPIASASASTVSTPTTTQSTLDTAASSPYDYFGAPKKPATISTTTTASTATASTTTSTTAAPTAAASTTTAPTTATTDPTVTTPSLASVSGENGNSERSIGVPPTTEAAVAIVTTSTSEQPGEVSRLKLDLEQANAQLFKAKCAVKLLSRAKHDNALQIADLQRQLESKDTGNHEASSLSKKLVDLQNELEKSQLAVNQKTELTQELRQSLAGQSLLLEQKQSLVDSVSRESALLKAQLAEQREKATHSTEKLTQAAEAFKKAKLLASTFKGQLELKEKELVHLRERAVVPSKDLREQQVQLDLAKEEIERRKAREREAMIAVEELKERAKELQQQLEQQRQVVPAPSVTVTSCAECEQRANLAQELAQRESDLAAHHTELEELRADLKSREASLLRQEEAIAQRQPQSADEQFQQLTEKLANYESTIASLQQQAGVTLANYQSEKNAEIEAQALLITQLKEMLRKQDEALQQTVSSPVDRALPPVPCTECDRLQNDLTQERQALEELRGKLAAASELRATEIAELSKSLESSGNGRLDLQQQLATQTEQLLLLQQQQHAACGKCQELETQKQELEARLVLATSAAPIAAENSVCNSCASLQQQLEVQRDTLAKEQEAHQSTVSKLNESLLRQPESNQAASSEPSPREGRLEERVLILREGVKERDTYIKIQGNHLKVAEGELKKAREEKDKEISDLRAQLKAEEEKANSGMFGRFRKKKQADENADPGPGYSWNGRAWVKDEAGPSIPPLPPLPTEVALPPSPTLNPDGSEPLRIPRLKLAPASSAPANRFMQQKHATPSSRYLNSFDPFGTSAEPTATLDSGLAAMLGGTSGGSGSSIIKGRTKLPPRMRSGANGTTEETKESNGDAAPKSSDVVPKSSDATVPAPSGALQQEIEELKRKLANYEEGEANSAEDKSLLSTIRKLRQKNTETTKELQAANQKLQQLEQNEAQKANGQPTPGGVAPQQEFAAKLAAQKQVTQLKGEIDVLNSKLKNAQAHRDELLEELKKHEAQRDISTPLTAELAQEQVEALKQRGNEEQQNQHNLQNEVSQLKAALEMSQRQVESLRQAETSTVEAEKDASGEAAQRKVAQLTKELAVAAARIKQLESEPPRMAPLPSAQVPLPPHRGITSQPMEEKKPLDLVPSVADSASSVIANNREIEQRSNAGGSRRSGCRLFVRLPLTVFFTVLIAILLTEIGNL